MIHPQDLLELRASGQGSPKYLVLKDYLLGRIASNQLRPGDLLPTEQVLAESLGVARNTVRQALGDLAKQGLIQRVRGRGTFVCDPSPNMIASTTAAARATQVEQPQLPAKNKFGEFALVVGNLEEQYVQTLLRGFEEQAKARRGQVVICTTNEDVGKQADVFLQLLDRGVGGVALWPTVGEDTPPYHIRHLQKQGVPVVLCHRPVEGARAPLVWVSYAEIGRRAGEAFLHYGHRRAAMFVTCMSLASRQYEESLRQSMETGGGTLPAEFTYYGGHWDPSLQEPAICAALERMISAPDPPTAVLVGFYSTAEIIYLCAQRLGLDVPKDLSIITVGGVGRGGARARRF